MTHEEILKRLKSDGGSGTQVIRTLQSRLQLKLGLRRKPTLTTETSFRSALRHLRDTESSKLKFPVCFIKYGVLSSPDNSVPKYSDDYNIEVGTDLDITEIKVRPARYEITFYILSDDVLDLIDFDDVWRLSALNASSFDFRLQVLNEQLQYETTLADTLSNTDKQDYIEDVPYSMLEGTITVDGFVWGSREPHVRTRPRITHLNDVELETFDSSTTSLPTTDIRTKITGIVEEDLPIVDARLGIED